MSEEINENDLPGQSHAQTLNEQSKNPNVQTPHGQLEDSHVQPPHEQQQDPSIQPSSEQSQNPSAQTPPEQPHDPYAQAQNSQPQDPHAQAQYGQPQDPYAQAQYGQPQDPYAQARQYARTHYGEPQQNYRQPRPAPEVWIQQSRTNAEYIVDQQWFRVYWVAFLILCILSIESFFKSGIALGTVLLFVMAEVLAIFFAKYTKGKLNKKALILAVPIALINAGHLLFYSISVQIVTWPVVIVLFVVQLTYLSKPEKERLFELRNVSDFLHTAFANAFVFISYPFKGIKFTKEKNKSVTVQIIIGILISIPIAAVFLFLFSSADESFSTIIKKFTEDFSSNFGDFVTDLVLGALMCIFVSAAFVGANAREPRPRTQETTFKGVSNVILGTVLLVVAVIVALYVGIQFNHWFGNVPVNYIQMDEYSNLARSGFFELVVASCLLLALIITIAMISTKRNGQLTPLIKAPLLLLGACNLIILYSAVEKMAVYIGRSGITSSRILVLWLIAVIVVIIVSVIIKTIRFSFKAFGLSFAAVVVLACGLSFCNMDYYVAKNHIYLAEHHMIQNLELDMLSNLSYAAAEPIAEYKSRLENGESAFETTRMQSCDTVIRILDRELWRHKKEVDRLTEENPVMGFNFSRFDAQNAFKKYGYEIPLADKTANINVMLTRPDNWERIASGPVISEYEMEILDGSTATIPITAELFRQFYEQSDDDIEQNPIVFHSTTHNAYINLIDREYRYYIYGSDLPTSLILVTGPSDEEKNYAKSKGVELDLTPIAMDGFVFITHIDNPVDSLTIEQIQGIYTGAITNWSEVGGKDLRIKAYQREQNSGSQTAMEQMVMQGQPMRLPIEAYSVDDVYYGMGMLVDAVAEFENGPASIGYTYYYYINNLYKNENIKVIKVDGIAPVNENLLSGTYPFATYYYAVIRSDEAKKSPARILRDYLVSPEGQDIIAMAGYCRVK